LKLKISGEYRIYHP